MASNFAIQPAYSNTQQHIEYFDVAAGQTFIAGALVLYDTTNNNITECGADPASILGIACAPASVGLATAGSIYGGTKIPVLIINSNTLLKIASATTPAESHRGDSYGVAKSTNWLLDTAEVTTMQFVVQQVSTSPEFFVVRPLAAACQFDAIAS